MDIHYQKKIAEKYNRDVIIIQDLNKAIESLLNDNKDKDLLLITGSLYLIGEVKKYFADK